MMDPDDLMRMLDPAAAYEALREAVTGRGHWVLVADDRDGAVALSRIGLDLLLAGGWAHRPPVYGVVRWIDSSTGERTDVSYAVVEKGWSDPVIRRAAEWLAGRPPLPSQDLFIVSHRQHRLAGFLGAVRDGRVKPCPDGTAENN